MHLKLSAAKDDRQNSTVTTITAKTIAACYASLSTLISQLFGETLVTSHPHVMHPHTSCSDVPMSKKTNT